MRSCILLAAVALAPVLVAYPPPQQVEHEKAIAAIKKLGGAVEIAHDKPGQPATVALTGSKSAPDCLAHIKDIVNLQCLDL